MKIGTGSHRRPKGHVVKWAIVFCMALVAIVAMACRIHSVNEQVPEESLFVYEIGDQVPYSSEKKGDEAIDAVFTVTGFAMLDDEGISRMVSGYVNPSISAGAANESKTLLVAIHVSNNSDGAVYLPSMYLNAVAGSWHNAADMLLLDSVNPEISTVLEAGAECDFLCPFTAIDSQFGFNRDAWNAFEEQRFRLEISAYPIKTSIDIGVPESMQELLPGLMEGVYGG